MSNLKESINRIVPYSELADFISNRLIDDNYRGIQMSQHNRYVMQDVINILKCLNAYGHLEILVGDDNGNYPATTHDYIEFVAKVKEINGKGTLNSIKKNLFPDFHRMGLIERYDDNNKPVDPYERTSIKYVEISKLGKQFITETNLKNQYFIFLKAIEKLSQGFIDSVKDLLLSHDKLVINDIEMALFATGIGQTFSNQYYSFETICDLYHKWSSLTKNQKQSVIQVVKNWCDERLNLEPKNKKRDFHNWINESQQIISLFAQTSFFERDKYNLYLIFGVAKSMFETITDAKRSLIQKNLYYVKHSIQKTGKFRLHHIVPLHTTETIAEYKLLDCWENMIYINSDTHSDIHDHEKMRPYALSFDNDDAVFTSTFDSNFSIKARFDVEAKYKRELKGLMLEKNIDFLSIK